MRAAQARPIAVATGLLLDPLDLGMDALGGCVHDVQHGRADAGTQGELEPYARSASWPRGGCTSPSRFTASPPSSPIPGPSGHIASAPRPRTPRNPLEQSSGRKPGSDHGFLVCVHIHGQRTRAEACFKGRKQEPRGVPTGL